MHAVRDDGRQMGDGDGSGIRYRPFADKAVDVLSGLLPSSASNGWFHLEARIALESRWEQL
jgi:hypothetical protein